MYIIKIIKITKWYNCMLLNWLIEMLFDIYFKGVFFLSKESRFEKSNKKLEQRLRGLTVYVWKAKLKCFPVRKNFLFVIEM